MHKDDIVRDIRNRGNRFSRIDAKHDVIRSPTGKYLRKRPDVRLVTKVGNGPFRNSEIQQKWMTEKTFRKGEIGLLNGGADGAGAYP